MRRTLFPVNNPVTNRDVTRGNVGTVDPFAMLQREMNRIFDDVWRGGTPANWNWSWNVPTEFAAPRVDVSEDEKAIHVTAELPGLSEKDIELSYNDGVLRLAGEKTMEHENQDRQVYVSERSYGRFERHLPIDRPVEQDRIEAAFKDGVLHITLPKAAQAESTRRIEVKRAA